MAELKPLVVALPCSGSGGNQWRSLEAALNGRCTVLALDLMDYTAALAAAGNRDFTLLHEAGPVLRILDNTVSPIHLVGHSYGGAVALRAAVERPQKISSLTLFEPTSFHLLEPTCPQDVAALSEVQRLASDVSRLIALEKPEDAARIFVDYWAGCAVWTKLRPETKEGVSQYAPKATLEFSALFNEPMLLQDYAKLRVPVFIMGGEFALAPTHRIARRLAATLPVSFHATIPGVGHMGPVTNAAQIAAEISNFIAHSRDLATASGRAAA
jgi:pimeloyl-ACP methyl ester carboxylesterase